MKDFDQSRKKLLSISLVAIRQWIVARLEKIARNCIIRYLQRDPLFQVVSLISLKITQIRDWIKKEPNFTVTFSKKKNKKKIFASRDNSRENESQIATNHPKSATNTKLNSVEKQINGWQIRRNLFCARSIRDKREFHRISARIKLASVQMATFSFLSPYFSKTRLIFSSYRGRRTNEHVLFWINRGRGGRKKYFLISIHVWMEQRSHRSKYAKRSHVPIFAFHTWVESIYICNYYNKQQLRIIIVSIVQFVSSETKSCIIWRIIFPSMRSSWKSVEKEEAEKENLT